VPADEETRSTAATKQAPFNDYDRAATEERNGIIITGTFHDTHVIATQGMHFLHTKHRNA